MLLSLVFGKPNYGYKIFLILQFLLKNIHTTLFAIKGSNNKKIFKKTNKTKKKKRNKPLQDKSNTTGQHNSILGLIFSTQSTNDIIG